MSLNILDVVGKLQRPDTALIASFTAERGPSAFGDGTDGRHRHRRPPPLRCANGNRAGPDVVMNPAVVVRHGRNLLSVMEINANRLIGREMVPMRTDMLAIEPTSAC